jgi:hypothetical protein
MAKKSYSLIRMMALLAAAATLVFLVLTIVILSFGLDLTPWALLGRVWRQLLVVAVVMAICLGYIVRRL